MDAVWMHWMLCWTLSGTSMPCFSPSYRPLDPVEPCRPCPLACHWGRFPRALGNGASLEGLEAVSLVPPPLRAE